MTPDTTVLYAKGQTVTSVGTGAEKLGPSFTAAGMESAPAALESN